MSIFQKQSNIILNIPLASKNVKYLDKNLTKCVQDLNTNFQNTVERKNIECLNKWNAIFESEASILLRCQLSPN